MHWFTASGPPCIAHHGEASEHTDSSRRRLKIPWQCSHSHAVQKWGTLTPKHSQTIFLSLYVVNSLRKNILEPTDCRKMNHWTAKGATIPHAFTVTSSTISSYPVGAVPRRVPNDELLANEVSEVDLILAGHDHHYDVKPVSASCHQLRSRHVVPGCA